MKTSTLVKLAFALTAWTDIATASGNLIKNAGFERPAPPQGYFTTYYPGDKMGSWSVVGPGNVAIVSTSYTAKGISLEAKRGLAYLDLTGICDCGAASGVAQSVATTPGITYKLTFWVGNTNIPENGNTSTVNAYNASDLLITAENKSGQHSLSQVWKKFTVSFVAVQAKTTLTFINGDGDMDTNCGLDNITLTSQ